MVEVLHIYVPGMQKPLGNAVLRGNRADTKDVPDGIVLGVDGVDGFPKA